MIVVSNPDDCMQCNMCADACPTHAITRGGYGTAERQLPVTIDHDVCIECGECINTCPNGCISEEVE